ncbi:VENN motif pre-toxin domain-containing protein [Snodgrassella communis]|uniref:VENN motif pre-toxin domain-containing protein n=1 Tax=Snodgrassella communis TaxID=2946699 RepID=UPI001EF5FCC0|nr:VENN motif pre-toxin domain-containing protein [Snodgrassella communis]
MSHQIGQYFKVLAHKNQITGGKDELTAGQEAAHILAHTILGAAVAAAGGNDALAGGLAAAGAEATAPILSQWLYGKNPADLTADEKATVSAIAGLTGAATGVTVGGSMADVAQGNQAGHTAVDNNELVQRTPESVIQNIEKRKEKIKSEVCTSGMSQAACNKAIAAEFDRNNAEFCKMLIDLATLVPGISEADALSILLNEKTLSGDETSRIWGAIGIITAGYGQKLRLAGKELLALNSAEELVTSTGHVIKNAEANAIKNESRGVGKEAGKEATNVTQVDKGASEANKLLKETQAAERLGVNLNNIKINNGTARTEIKITNEINYSDVRLLVDSVKLKGAQRVEVNTGYIANEKLMDFLEKRVVDGKPFMGGKVIRGNSKSTDFTIIYE